MVPLVTDVLLILSIERSSHERIRKCYWLADDQNLAVCLGHMVRWPCISVNLHLFRFFAKHHSAPFDEE